MNKILHIALFAIPSLLLADVIPTINSKGGAMVLPEEKLKIAFKHIDQKQRMIMILEMK